MVEIDHCWAVIGQENWHKCDDNVKLVTCIHKRIEKEWKGKFIVWQGQNIEWTFKCLCVFLCRCLEDLPISRWNGMMKMNCMRAAGIALLLSPCFLFSYPIINECLSFCSNFYSGVVVLTCSKTCMGSSDMHWLQSFHAFYVSLCPLRALLENVTQFWKGYQVIQKNFGGSAVTLSSMKALGVKVVLLQKVAKGGKHADVALRWHPKI